MTEQQITLVQASWKQVEPITDQAADLFYRRLFELDRTLRGMFPEDLTQQKKKLMQIIGVAVGALRKLDTIVPAVQAMGQRHRGYGVTDQHYDLVGQALLWTLEQGLGEAFTEEVRVAWTETYTVLSTTMKSAAAQAA